MKATFQESETIEFKSSFNEATIETLVAFANTKGGTVYIVGVNDDAIIQGIQIGKETIQKWLNEIKIKTQPAIIPTVKELDFKGKIVVTIYVQEFPVKPISYKGRYYKRVNNSNHQLSPIEITDLNLQSLQLSWDAYEKQGKTVADLDIDKMKQFIARVNESGRFKLTGEWKTDLQKLKLISNEKITNAAWLLFANEDSNYNIHIGRFKTPSLIIDDKMLRGTLFEVVEEAMNYILAHIKVAFEITGETTKRIEIFEYPLTALRELLLNSIIHRDYLSPIDLQIKIFDQRITFYNPGGLFGDLTLEQLKEDNYQANTRNKLIAEAFYLTGDIEKYGSDVIRIRKEIKSYPTMTFSIEAAPNGLLTALSYEQQKITEELNVVENVVENVGEKVGDKVGKNLNINQTEIIRLILNNNYISAKAISLEIHISLRKVEENIAKLKKLGLLKRIGPAKGGYWQVINPGNE